jgi:hypothetical protein
MKSKQNTTKTLQVEKDVRNPHPFHCDCGDELKRKLIKKIKGKRYYEGEMLWLDDVIKIIKET